MEEYLLEQVKEKGIVDMIISYVGNYYHDKCMEEIKHTLIHNILGKNELNINFSIVKHYKLCPHNTVYLYKTIHYITTVDHNDLHIIDAVKTKYRGVFCNKYTYNREDEIEAYVSYKRMLVGDYYQYRHQCETRECRRSHSKQVSQ